MKYIAAMNKNVDIPMVNAIDIPNSGSALISVAPVPISETMVLR